MRLWSLHPAVLDRAALVAGWREGLLAQKVLRGLTKGYRHHPQLQRFQACPNPVDAVAAWLHGLADEADARGYRFDRSRIAVADPRAYAIEVTTGQLAYELEHLRTKVGVRDPAWLPRVTAAAPHPVFTVVDGPVADWERP